MRLVKYLAGRYAVILASCLLAASSSSQPSMTGVQAPDMGSSVLSGGQLHLTRPSLTSPSLANDASSESDVDMWLSLLLGVGLVVVQLRRRQRILQAPRLVN